ncbi:MAG: Gfo/Idh/MocA family oxidoreductase [Planctomycetia bacterium]|nr:Gfo/Idh/MocA family oxidoreductase [Planctomycetia bacterium]
MSENPLRVGIIGFGMIGKVHAFAHQAMSYYAPLLPIRCQITSVATIHKETAEKAKRIIGCDFATTNFKEITENPDIDIVHICSPNDQHFPALLSAIRQNKNIYCDKPLVVSLNEAKKIDAELSRTDSQGKRLYTKTSQMTFHLRFFSAIKRMKQILDENRIGRIFQYRIGYYHASNISRQTPFKWKHGESGGAIRDLVSHLLDLVDFLIGLPEELLADSIIAYPNRPLPLASAKNVSNATYYQTVESEDSVSILTRGLLNPPASSDPLFSPVQGVIEASKLATGCEDDLRLEIHGEKGALRFSLMNPHYLEFFDATLSDRPFGGYSGWLQIPCGGRYEFPDADFPSHKSSTGWIRAHIASLSNFLNDIANNRPGNPSLLQGIRIQSALDAVAKSCQSRLWTPVLTDN